MKQFVKANEVQVGDRFVRTEGQELVTEVVLSETSVAIFFLDSDGAERFFQPLDSTVEVLIDRDLT